MSRFFLLLFVFGVFTSLSHHAYADENGPQFMENNLPADDDAPIGELLDQRDQIKSNNIELDVQDAENIPESRSEVSSEKRPEVEDDIHEILPIDRILESKITDALNSIEVVVQSTNKSILEYFTNEHNRLNAVFANLKEKIEQESSLVYRQLDFMIDNARQTVQNLKKYSFSLVNKSFKDVINDVSMSINKVVSKMENVATQIKDSLKISQEEFNINPTLVEFPKLLIDKIKTDNEKIKKFAARLQIEPELPQSDSLQHQELEQEAHESGDFESISYAKNLVDAIQNRLKVVWEKKRASDESKPREAEERNGQSAKMLSMSHHYRPNYHPRDEYLSRKVPYKGHFKRKVEKPQVMDKRALNY